MCQIEMLVWLSWQSSSLVMSRSPVRIRPQAPQKTGSPHGRPCFLLQLPESKFIPGGEIRPQAPKKGSLWGAFFRSLRLLKCEGSYPLLRAKSRPSGGCALAQRLRALAPRAPPCRFVSLRTCKRLYGHKLHKKAPFGEPFLFLSLLDYFLYSPTEILQEGRWLLPN